ncbi:hypothetical protein JZ751_028193 [Albula glossodonta]|uniref:Uncharacterized protein n=1 Tax=Albula glossodonta TaxID=121402 RepID=A0A8T2PB28_9TELE|nr:hypothetical protein JZ751_028193 [Albula glossodonta]
MQMFLITDFDPSNLLCKRLEKMNEHDEMSSEKKNTGFLGVSLESLNKLNSNSGGSIRLDGRRSSIEKPLREQVELGRTDEASSSCSEKPGVDNLGSLSDSLYDSFSSCASQGSNDLGPYRNAGGVLFSVCESPVSLIEGDLWDEWHNFHTPSPFISSAVTTSN